MLLLWGRKNKNLQALKKMQKFDSRSDKEEGRIVLLISVISSALTIIKLVMPENHWYLK